MSKVLKEINVTIGEYKTKTGETKKKHLRIGSVLETKVGPMLKLDAIPIQDGGWDGWAYINEPKKHDDQPSNKKGSGFEDLEDLPF